MEKDFVPYELSLGLKELGFDEPCFGRYDGKGKNKGKIWYEMPNSGQDSIPVGDVSAPTFSQAFRWFREKYGLHQVVLADVNGKYDIIVGERISGSCLGQYETYEQAELECLKKLIEIVKSQKTKSIT